MNGRLNALEKDWHYNFFFLITLFFHMAEDNHGGIYGVVSFKVIIVINISCVFMSVFFCMYSMV